MKACTNCKSRVPAAAGALAEPEAYVQVSLYHLQTNEIHTFCASANFLATSSASLNAKRIAS
jgi:hypothetical protein